MFNFFKRLINKLRVRGDPDDFVVDIEMGSEDYMNFVTITCEIDESGDSVFTYHYDSRFDEVDVYEFLEDSLFSLDVYFDFKAEEAFKEKKGSKKKKSCNFKVIEGEKK